VNSRADEAEVRLDLRILTECIRHFLAGSVTVVPFISILYNLIDNLRDNPTEFAHAVG